MKINVDFIYPIGSIYMSVNSTNPSTLFGRTWSAWGKGRVPVGIDTSQSEFNSVEKNWWRKKHTLTVGEMPSHNHDLIIDQRPGGSYAGAKGSWGTAYTGTDIYMVKNKRW